MSNTYNRTITKKLETLELCGFNTKKCISLETKLKLSDRDKSIPISLTFFDCSLGKSDKRDTYTVFDIENVESFSSHSSCFRGVKSTSHFSPKACYFHDSHFVGDRCDSFILNSNARLYAAGTRFEDMSLLMRGDAFITVTFSAFRSTRFLSNLSPDITPNKCENRYYENTFSSVHVENNAFVNAVFEKCMFNYIFVHDSGVNAIGGKAQFENCTFEESIFIEIDPFKKNRPIFHKCKFVNCHFVDKQESMFKDCEFVD